MLDNTIIGFVAQDDNARQPLLISVELPLISKTEFFARNLLTGHICKVLAILAQKVQTQWSAIRSALLSCLPVLHLP